MALGGYFLLQQQHGCNFLTTGTGCVGSITPSHRGPHLVCPLILSAACKRQTQMSVEAYLNPSGYKEHRTNQGTPLSPSSRLHEPQTIAITQNNSTHLFQWGWLQPKQPQTKHKLTSAASVSLSLGLIQKPPQRAPRVNKNCLHFLDLSRWLHSEGLQW